MTFARHFSQVFQSNLQAYIDSRSPKGFTAQFTNLLTNTVTKMSGYNSAEETLPVCGKLVSEASGLTEETLPAFLIKIGDYADQWIKTSWGESSSAHYLFLMISYAKLKEQATPHDPHVQKFQIARNELVTKLQQADNKSTKEETAKRLVYLGQIPKNSTSTHYINAADAKIYFPETTPGKVMGSAAPYKHYTYHSDALVKAKFDKKALPPIDEKLPLELQDNYAWLHLEGRYSPDEVLRRLEVDAHIDSYGDLIKQLNDAQAALAKTIEHLTKFTDLEGADAKIPDGLKESAKLSVEHAKLVKEHQRFNREKEEKHLAALTDLAKRYEAADAASKQRILELEKPIAGASPAPDAKMIEKIKADTIAEQKKLHDEAMAKLKVELAAANVPNDALVRQSKADGAAEVEKKFQEERAKLQAELQAQGGAMQAAFHSQRAAMQLELDAARAPKPEEAHAQEQHKLVVNALRSELTAKDDIIAKLQKENTALQEENRKFRAVLSAKTDSKPAKPVEAGKSSDAGMFATKGSGKPNKHAKKTAAAAAAGAEPNTPPPAAPPSPSST